MNRLEWYEKNHYRSAILRILAALDFNTALLSRYEDDIEGTSMIGKSQGETEIPLDSVEWVLRAGG